MNFFHKAIFCFAFLTMSLAATAQDNNDIQELIKQGVALNDQGKYAEAIEKYNQALKIDSSSTKANYELAFSLFASGKGIDAIPFAEKTIKGSSSPTLTAASYDLLGSIYDQDHQPGKAVEAYRAGIKIKPDYQRLHYNLGLAYFRNKQYVEAEASAIEAIKLDPKHAGSQRMYALVTFHQNKRVCALLGFCSFLLLEPQGPRSAEAFTNIQHILQGGVIKDAGGGNTIQLSPKDNEETQTLNLAISMTALAAQKQKLTGMALLEFEFKHIFAITGELSEKKTDKSFFDKFYADFFYKLSQTNNMPAFTRLMSLTANREENTKWMAENDAQVKALDSWVAANPRSF